MPAEDGGQQTDGRKQRTEDRERKTEDQIMEGGLNLFFNEVSGLV